MTDVYTIDDDGSAAPFICKNGERWSLAGRAIDNNSVTHIINALNAYEKERAKASTTNRNMIGAQRQRMDAIGARLEDVEKKLDSICSTIAKIYERIFALENPNPCKTREQVEAQ